MISDFGYEGKIAIHCIYHLVNLNIFEPKKLRYLQHITTFESLKKLWYSFYICNQKGQNSTDLLNPIKLYFHHEP